MFDNTHIFGDGECVVRRAGSVCDAVSSQPVAIVFRNEHTVEDTKQRDINQTQEVSMQHLEESSSDSREQTGADFPSCTDAASKHNNNGSTGSQPDNAAADGNRPGRHAVSSPTVPAGSLNLGGAATIQPPVAELMPLTPALSPLGGARGEADFVVGDTITGSSAPGQSRSDDSGARSVIANLDGPAAGSGVEQVARQRDAGPHWGDQSERSAECAGCVATGDPSQGVDMPPMNHQALPISVEPVVQEKCTARPTPVQPIRRQTTDQVNHGTLALARLEAVLAFRKLEGNENAGWKKVTKATGVTAVEFCRWRKRIAEAGLTLESQRSALITALAKQSPPGRKAKFFLTEAEAAKVAAHNLQSNRTETAGSPQEALRHAIKRGEVSPATAAVLQQREAEGKPLLTEAMRRTVQVAETTTRADRTPREAWLQYVQSPGSLQITVDEATGLERMFVPGEAWTMDDATINLILCVAMEQRDSKCWQNFGVVVGRFQFIVPADHASYLIPGFSFTARPRSSYRAEDLTATLQIAFREHGMPRLMFLEQGISKAKLIHETLGKLGIKIKHVKSPHQKIVEMLFNKLWTKLSFLPGQVGRHMGDDEETTKLMMRCRAGQVDPRKHFLMLHDVVKALREAIEEHNSGWINHSRYGRWIPREFWQQKSPAMLRTLDEDCEWMFSPVIKGPLTVRGFNVKTTIQLMEGMSQQFTFGAQWLHEFHGAKVKLFFNPFLDAPAKVVLAEDFRGFKAEAILGNAEMVDRHARFNLRNLGYGAGPDGQPGFPDIGLAAARQNAQALRRSVVAIRPDGKPGIVSNESRDMKTVPKPGENTAPKPASDFLRRARGLGADDDAFDRQAAKLRRDEARLARTENTLVESLD